MAIAKTSNDVSKSRLCYPVIYRYLTCDDCYRYNYNTQQSNFARWWNWTRNFLQRRPCLRPCKKIMTWMLTRDLFAVANILVNIRCRLHTVPTFIIISWFINIHISSRSIHNTFDFVPKSKVRSTLSNVFLPANCRYCFFYSQAKNQLFRPAGATRCTDSCETWHDQGTHGSAWPHEISRQSVYGVGTRPQMAKISAFWFGGFLHLLEDFISPTILL